MWINSTVKLGNPCPGVVREWDKGTVFGQWVWGLLTSWEVRDETIEPNMVIYTGWNFYRSHVKSCWSLLLNCFVFSSFLSPFAHSIYVSRNRGFFWQMWIPRLNKSKTAQIISKGLKKQPSKTNKTPYQLVVTRPNLRLCQSWFPGGLK